MVLHLPIGVLCALVAAELWGRLRRRPLERGARLVLTWFLVITAGVSVGSGIVLSGEPGYVDETIVIHKWLGIITGAALLATAAFATFRWDRGYLAVLIMAAILIIPTGHFGASMTHGKGFLTAPFAKQIDMPASDGASGARPSWYASRIAPILETHCTVCHGETRRKSGLSLHTVEAVMRGGESGSVLMTDDGGPGALLRRIRLPLTDNDHMPPEGKPQLSTVQIERLARWIEAGAPIDALAPEGASVVAGEAAPPPPRVVRELPRQAVADLQAAHAHVEVIDPESNGLWIDFTAAPSLPVDEIVRLLGPLAANTTELSLRGVAKANEVLTECAPWEQLRRLDLSQAGVDRDGLAAAAEQGNLVELALIGATLTIEAAEELARLDTVEVLHVWGANIPAGALAKLRERDTLVVNDGSVDPPAPIEIEPEFEFGKPKTIVAALEPVNTQCPVTGAPIDVSFSIVHEGRVVAFCCNVCPGRFWDDPSQFTVIAGESSADEPSADERALFDAETLDGWHAIGGGSWSVEEGVIVGRSSKDVAEHGLLVSDRTYDDFEVTFEYRVFEGDSGFYFRAEESEGALGVAGFQVEVDDVEPGGLYETAGRGWVVKPTPEEAAAWHRSGEWNAVTLVAVGPQLTVTINGIQTAQLDDPDGRTKGVFALQLHGGQDMHVQYRDIRLRDR